MTNKWEVAQLAQERVIIQRVEDGIPILEMVVATEDGSPLLNGEQAVDIAQQIVDDWNFSCEDLEMTPTSVAPLSFRAMLSAKDSEHGKRSRKA